VCTRTLTEVAVSVTVPVNVWGSMHTQGVCYSVCIHTHRGVRVCARV